MPGEEAKAGEDLIRSSDKVKAERDQGHHLGVGWRLSRQDDRTGLGAGDDGGGQGRICRVF